MRRLFVVTGLFLLWLSVQGTAQISVGGYFSASGAYSTVNDEGGILPSAGAALVLGGKYGIGLSLAALVPTIHADSLSASGKPLAINLFYYGATLEYLHNPDDFFQYGGMVFVGAGHVGFSESVARHNADSNATGPNYSFGFVEPEVSGILAFNENLQVRAAVGWRAVFGREEATGPAGALAGPVASLGFRIGFFPERVPAICPVE